MCSQRRKNNDERNERRRQAILSNQKFQENGLLKEFWENKRAVDMQEQLRQQRYQDLYSQVYGSTPSDTHMLRYPLLPNEIL